MSRFSWLGAQIEELRRVGLVREPRDSGLREEVGEVARRAGCEFVDASSNDYLGYGSGGVDGLWGGGSGSKEDPLGVSGLEVEDAVGAVGSRDAHLVSRETLTHLSNRADPRPEAEPPSPTPSSHQAHGSGASRLLGGTRPEHVELERLLAEWVGQEDSLVFSSGYAANVGLLSCLPQAGDMVFSDAYNHASIIDGCRLNGAETHVYPHLNLAALTTQLRENSGKGRRFIVTESYFSMDADSPDLRKLRTLADENHALLIVDEAHALGIFGPRGAGIAAQQSIQPDIVVGTLGKAVGLQGAFIAGPNILRTWLWNRARSFVYSTAPTPTLAWQTQLHVKHIQRNDEARRRLAKRTDTLRTRIAELELTVPANSHGPIVPILLGSVELATKAANAFRAKGILAYPIRPPTVPKDTARLRLTITAAMSDAGFSQLLDALPECLNLESSVQ